MLLDKLQKLQELQLTVYTMQLITSQLQLCCNNFFSTTMQLPYDYNHNVMLMSFFIHQNVVVITTKCGSSSLVPVQCTSEFIVPI